MFKVVLVDSQSGEDGDIVAFVATRQRADFIAKQYDHAKIVFFGRTLQVFHKE